MSAPARDEFAVRPATAADIGAMQQLEIDAGRRFRELGMDAIADDDPPDAAVLADHVGGGTAWVAVDHRGSALGYALASVVDGEGHLDQVSVGHDAGRRGVGSALVEQVCAWARGCGFDAVTLTTFRDVAFNGPYYRKLGFVDLPDADLGPELTAIRDRERASAIEVAPRLAMRRRVAPGSGGDDQ
jgi:GNAT superfamily N-acetyltransferase